MADGTIIIDTKINTDGFKNGMTDEQKEIKRLEANLDKLIEKQIRFTETGGNINSRSFKTMEYDIAQTSARLDELKSKQMQITTSTASLGNGIEIFKRALQNLLPNLASASKMLVNFTGTSIINGFKKLGNSVKDMGKRILQLGRHTNGTHSSMLKMLGTSILFSMTFKAISTVINGLKEGINNLAQYSSDTNAMLSLLKSSLTQLKNSFGTAFAPILSVVTPILNGFIKSLSDTINSIGMLMASLTGKGTFTKAIEVQEDYAAGLDNTSNSAKKAEKALNGYLNPLDEISKFENPASAQTAVTVSPSQMFQEISIDSSIADVAGILKEKIKDGDWKGVGNLLADKLNGIFSKIDFAAAGSKLGDAIKNLIDGINGFLEETDWQMIGNKVADFIGGIDWSGLVNRLVEGIGATLGGLAGLLWGIIQPAWDSVVKWWQDNAYEDGQFTISGLLNGILKGLKNIGKWIKENIFDPFIKGFKNAFGIASPSKEMEKMGVYLIEGLLEGITSLIDDVISIFSDLKSKISKIWEEIYTNLSDKWDSIRGGAKVFGSRVRENLTNDFKILKDNLSNTLREVASKFSSNWDSIYSNTSQWVSGLSSNVSNTFDRLKSRISDIAYNLYISLHSKWGSMADNASQWVSYMYKSITGVFSDVKYTVVNIFDNLTYGIKNAINNVIYVINRMIGGIVDGLNSAIYALNRLSFSIPSWIPLIGGNHFGLNIRYVSAPQIPYLASGAVIPPNAPFTAVLGDQKNGRNLETPEDLLRQIVREESGSGAAQYQFIAQINRRTLFDEFIEEAKMRQIQSGANPFRLA